MKIIKYLILPMVLILTLLLATPAMAAEEVFTEPVARPTKFQSYETPEKSLIAKSDLKKFDEIFLKEAASCQTYIDIESVGIPYSNVAIQELQEHIWYDLPEAFHCYSIGVGHNNMILTTVMVGQYYSFSDTPEEYAVCYEQFRNGADRLLEGVEDNDALTDVEKALLLHDRLALWTAYDMEIGGTNTDLYPDKDFTAYGALGTRVAVCQGYAMAYMYLLDRVGIENEYCSSNSLNHAWNIVYIDNKPYHVDVTWDDPVDDVLGRVRHDNFLRSTAGIKETNHIATDYNSTPVDTTYDDAYWQDSYASFQLLDGSIYYYDSVAYKLNRVDGDKITEILAVGSYSDRIKLSNANGSLLYSTEGDIFSFDPVTNTTIPVYNHVPEGEENTEWINGFTCEDGWLNIEITVRSPSYNYDTKYLRVPFSNQEYMPKNGWHNGKYYEDDKLVKNAWRSDETGRFYISQESTLTKEQWVMDGVYWCYVGVDGYCVKNEWLNDESGWCYLDDNGYMAVSQWVYYDGKTYYCDEGGYRVTGYYEIDGVSYIFGSDGALIEENASAIVCQPESLTADTGTTVQFSVTTQGKVKSYRWQYRKLHKWFDTALAGYNTDTLTVEAIANRNGYDYRCIVTFADGTVLNSDPAKLTVNTYITITGTPNDQVVVLGHKGQFTVAAEGEGLKFQWQYCRPGTSKWIDTAMEGAKKPTVYIETTRQRDGYQYRCKITDMAGKTVYSDAATLSVLSFVSHPVETFAAPGDTVEFHVTTSASSGFTYQWQYRRGETGKWTNTTLTGCKTATLKVPAKGKNNYWYRCVITGAKNGKLESKEAVLHVSNPVVINFQTEECVASVGDTAIFTVNASNAYSYRWSYRGTNTGWRDTAMTGFDTDTLQVPVTAGRNGYIYRCTIIGMDGRTYYSQEIPLVVKK